ncbi:MAG: orotate phosphoribosyltransferase [Candidatus Thorarchaeota archaeon]
MNDNLEILKQNIMRDIYENRMLLTSYRDKKEGWTLVSGLWSPFYIQLRLLGSFPETLKKVARAMTIFLHETVPNATKIVGIAFAGIPIATAISIESGLPACHTRKMIGVRTEEEMKRAIKEYGQHSLLEGVIEDGDVLCIVDDLVTGMESKLIARTQVLAEIERRGVRDVTCDDVAVILNRQQGAEERAKKAGIRLHSLIGFVNEGLPFLQSIMDPEEHRLISSYLSDPSQHQPI